jgi:hypothetical protein
MTGVLDERARGFWERYLLRYDRDVRFYDRLLFTGGWEWA